jgi:hypothetical protein
MGVIGGKNELAYFYQQWLLILHLSDLLRALRVLRGSKQAFLCGLSG